MRDSAAPHNSLKFSLRLKPRLVLKAILTAGYGWVARVACGSRDRELLN
jgi:hypothetical protein